VGIVIVQNSSVVIITRYIYLKEVAYKLNFRPNSEMRTWNTNDSSMNTDVENDITDRDGKKEFINPYIYIYIYRERERERDKGTERSAYLGYGV
jgi:hypothetical protein